MASPNLNFDQLYSNNSTCVTLVNDTPSFFTLNDQLKIFPNPAHHKVNIRLESKNPIERLDLFDLQGKRLAVQANLNGKEAQLDRSSLPAGIYFLKVYTKNGVGTQKVIFQ